MPGSLTLSLAGHLSGSRATPALCLPGPCSITCGALPGQPGPLSLGVGPRGHSPASPRGPAPWPTHRPRSGHTLCLGVQHAPLGGQVAEVLPRESGLGWCHPRAQRQQSWGTSTDPARPPTRWSPSASLSHPRNGNDDDGASWGCRQRTCSWSAARQPGSRWSCLPTGRRGCGLGKAAALGRKCPSHGARRGSRGAIPPGRLQGTSPSRLQPTALWAEGACIPGHCSQQRLPPSLICLGRAASTARPCLRLAGADPAHPGAHSLALWLRSGPGSLAVLNMQRPPEGCV